MIGSLTFTYNDNRFDIFKYKSKDLSDKVLRNSLDYNLYLFHNSPDKYIERVKNSGLIDGFNLTFGKITGTYPQALKAALNLLKKKGVKKIFFLQDDVFSCLDTQPIYKDLAEFARNTRLPYFNVEYNDTTNTITPLNEAKGFNVLDTTSQWFRDKGWWSWDDGAYCADLDYIMDVIYDETYFSYPDIWAAEHYLNYKFSRQNAPRPICNKGFFRRVNFIGNNDWNKNNELKFLNEKFV